MPTDPNTAGTVPASLPARGDKLLKAAGVGLVAGIGWTVATVTHPELNALTAPLMAVGLLGALCSRFAPWWVIGLWGMVKTVALIGIVAAIVESPETALLYAIMFLMNPVVQIAAMVAFGVWFLVGIMRCIRDGVL